MEEVRGYHVLKFTPSKYDCGLKKDYVNGILLAELANQQGSIEKEKFLHLIKQLAEQLSDCWKQNKAFGYGFVTPWSAVLTEHGQVLLLDMEEEHGEIKKFIQKRQIHSLFAPNFVPQSKEQRKREDLYGMGKTWQYLFAHVDIEPALTTFETRYFQKKIQICTNVQSKIHLEKETFIIDILKHYPKGKQKKKAKQKKKPKQIQYVIAVGLIVVAVGAGIRMKAGAGEHQSVEKSLVADEGTEHADPFASLTRKELVQCGLLLLAEGNQLERAAAWLEQADTQTGAQEGLVMTAYVKGGNQKTVLKARWETFGTNLKEAMQELPDETQMKLWEIFFRICCEAGEQEGRKEAIRIYETEEQKWSFEAGAYMEQIYTEEDQTEKVSRLYEQQLESGRLQEEQANQERLHQYERLAASYAASGDTKKQRETLNRAKEAFPQEHRIRIQEIQLVCSEEGVTKEEREQIVKEAVQAVTGLKETEEFQKLQQEYGIQIKEDQVWIEQ